MPLIAPKPPKLPKAPKPQTKPINRSGGQAGGNFAALHPRGRGGQWIVKPGDGYGSQGPDKTTAQLQQRLNQLGFKVPVDGKYGQQTAEAVQEFQKRYGLSSKLGVDAATKEFLMNPPSQTIDDIQREKGIGPYSKTAKAARALKSKSSTTKKITPAQAKVDKAVSKESQAATKQSVDAARQAHETRVDTTVRDARHDAQQARGDAARAKEIAKEAKAAAAGGSAQARKDARSAAHTARTAEREAKGAVKALKSLKQQLKQEKAQRISRAQAPLPGEVAVLAQRGGTVHVHAGSSPRMKVTPPIRRGGTPKASGGSANVQVATSAELPAEQPGLEEGLVLGTGSVPSNPIPDGRTTTPASDLPVWNRFGIRLPTPDYTIPDGRTAAPPPPTDTTIPDGRSTPEAITVALTEAIAARKAATTGREFTRALVRERVLRARLIEAQAQDAQHPKAPEVQRPLDEASYEEVLHPRGRGGKWIAKLGDKPHAAAPHLPEAATDHIVGSLKGKRGPEAYDALAGGEAVDTQKHHQTDGKYTLARQVLHQQVIDHFFKDAKPATGKPQAVFTAGGAASGKSTLAGQSSRTETNLDVPKGAVYINPDDIKAKLPEYDALKKQGRDDIAAAATHEESSDLAKLMTGLAMDGHYPVIVDGTGNSHVGKFGKKLQAASDAGYDVEARYAHVPVKEALTREQDRAKRTGRKVAERLLREQHQTVAESYVKDVAKMPNVHVKVYSTAERGRPKMIADKPAGGSLKVTDKKQYAEHVAKATPTEVSG